MKYSRTMTPDDTIQACLAEERHSINVLLYSGDIQPWVNLWEKENAAQNFANWLLTQLKNPGTIDDTALGSA